MKTRHAKSSFERPRHTRGGGSPVARRSPEWESPPPPRTRLDGRQRSLRFQSKTCVLEAVEWRSTDSWRHKQPAGDLEVLSHGELADPRRHGGTRSAVVDRQKQLRGREARLYGRTGEAEVLIRAFPFTIRSVTGRALELENRHAVRFGSGPGVDWPFAMTAL